MGSKDRVLLRRGGSSSTGTAEADKNRAPRAVTSDEQAGFRINVDDESDFRATCDNKDVIRTNERVQLSKASVCWYRTT